MAGPYNRDGHYMYGTGFQQPYPAYYGASWLHKKQAPRVLPIPPIARYAWEDAEEYQLATGENNMGLFRGKLVNSVVNIETELIKSLRLVLYANKEEDDKVVVLNLGTMYYVTYITEFGPVTDKGVLKYIDTTIPTDCTRYIGEVNETSITAWIGLDCSKQGQSIKRKIYIASIRAIDEVNADDPDYIPPYDPYDNLSTADKVAKIYDMLPEYTNSLDEIIAKLAEHDTSIMDRLNTMDPKQKLGLIDELIEAKSNEIKEHVSTEHATTNENIENSKTEVLDSIAAHEKNSKSRYNALRILISNHNVKIESAANQIIDALDDTKEAIIAGNEANYELMSKRFDEIITKLGDMPYDDKINLIYEKIASFYEETEDAMMTVTTRDGRTRYIISKLSDSGMVFLDDDGLPMAYTVNEVPYTTFQEAIAACPVEGTIKLEMDVSCINSPMIFTSGYYTLDLNGYDIHASSSTAAGIFLDNGAVVTICDSTDLRCNGMGKGHIINEVKYTDNGKSGIIKLLNGSKLIMDSGAILAADKDDPVHEGGFGIVLTGNSHLEVNGGCIRAGWYAISGNSSVTNSDSTITINGGKIISETNYAIYMPYDGTITVNSGVIFGAAGAISANNGTVIVHNGIITSKGNGEPGTWNSDSISTIEKAAINVNARYGATNLTITGGTVAAIGDAVAIAANPKNSIFIHVSGGRFSNMLKSTFIDAEYEQDDTPDADGMYRIHKIGETSEGQEYETEAQSMANPTPINYKRRREIMPPEEFDEDSTPTYEAGYGPGPGGPPKPLHEAQTTDLPDLNP